MLGQTEIVNPNLDDVSPSLVEPRDHSISNEIGRYSWDIGYARRYFRFWKMQKMVKIPPNPTDIIQFQMKLDDVLSSWVRV